MNGQHEERAATIIRTGLSSVCESSHGSCHRLQPAPGESFRMLAVRRSMWRITIASLFVTMIGCVCTSLSPAPGTVGAGSEPRIASRPPVGGVIQPTCNNI